MHVSHDKKTSNPEKSVIGSRETPQKRAVTASGELTLCGLSGSASMVGGGGCVGGQEKEWMGCFLDDLRAFGINADRWTTAAQDEGECRRTAEHFMAR